MAEKIYYSHIPGCRYVAKDCSEHFFVGGQLTTSNEAVQKELDEQIAKGGFIIRNKPHGEVDKVALQVKVAVDEAAVKAAVLAAKDL